MPSVLITGVGGPAGGNCARLFLSRGWTVLGVDMQQGIGEDPRGFQFLQVPASNAENYIETLSALIRTNHIDLLLPTVSEELPRIALERGVLPTKVALSPLIGVRAAHDKYLTWEAVTSAGISAPRALVGSEAVATPHRITSELGLPFISKPRVGRGGRGVQIHHHLVELLEIGPNEMLQEFAPGTEYSVNLHVGTGHDVAVVLEKLEMREGVTGNATRVERVRAPDVEDIALRTAALLGLRGLLDMDIRRSASGSPMLLEVNARPGANIGFAPEVFDAFLTSLDCQAWTT